MNIKSFESFYQDRILDKIASGGIESISKREREYLDSLSETKPDKKERIEREFGDRSKYIDDVLTWKSEDEDFELSGEGEEEILNTKYNILWDTFTEDDMEEFKKDNGLKWSDILDGEDPKVWDDLDEYIKVKFKSWIDSIN